MSRSIIIHGGPQRRGEEPRGTKLLAPMRCGTHSTPVSVAATVHRKPAGYLLAGLRADGRDHRTNPQCGPAIQTARKFFPALRASGNPIPGSTSVKPRKQSSHVRCPFTQNTNSFPAGPSGLVAAVYGHHSGVKEKKCPTKEFPGAEIVFPTKT